jgi:hypothetical protein
MSTITRDDVTAALVAFKRANGAPALRSLLERVAGVTAISQVPNAKFAAVMQAVKSPAPGRQAAKTVAGLDHKSIFARWNSFTRAPREDGGAT